MKDGTRGSKKQKPAAPVAKAAPRRKFQTGVRDRILKILAEGPIRNSVLQKRGKFTPSALYLHIKKLRESGILESRRMGRHVELSLKAHSEPKAPLEGEIIGEPAPVTKTKSSALATRVISPELRAALDSISHRLSPIERVEEKLVVLDQLARAMPAAITEVLHEVMADLVKLTALPSPR